MSKTPLLYVPGQNKTADELAALYEKIPQGVAERTERSDVRDPEDPFGFKQAPAPKTDNIEAAKIVAEKLTKFFQLLIEEFRLTPGAAMFAAELYALNVFNAEDVPLTPQERDAARERAFKHYEAARAMVPSPRKPNGTR